MQRISAEDFETDAAGIFIQARETVARVRVKDGFVEKFIKTIDEAEAEFQKGNKRESFEKITGVLRWGANT